MDFFETPEEVTKLLEQARARLKDFEENSDPVVLLGRLRSASPFHPALLARTLFLMLALFTVLGALGITALPWAMKGAPEWQVHLEKGLGVPLPAALFVIALCLGLAWMMAGQAALAMARDCPMMPAEQKEHERLINEVKRLSSQRALMERVRGTPMGARPRVATPVPPGARATGTPAPQARSNASGLSIPRMNPGGTSDPSARSNPAGLSVPRQTGSPSVPRMNAASSSLARGNPAGISVPRANPAGSSGPRLDAGAARLNPAAGSVPGYSPPAKAAPIVRPGKKDARAPAIPEITPEPVDDAIDDDAGAAEAPSAAGGAGFEQKYATDFPKWGAVDEPWLEDAIQKAEILATAFPVQAHLEFSPEPGLPFALILERATPAMAVRAMVSYVEFLASIATPPQARIVLRSVPHLDRSFHRNIEAALEPYFGEKAEVTRRTDRIDIQFAEPDPGWTEHPVLPFGTTT